MRKPATVSFKGACNQVAAGRWAADLLHGILKWWPHATRVFHDRVWIAKHSEDWIVEIGCSSLRTFQRAVQALRDQNLIETSQHLFGGFAILHVRPTDFALQTIGALYGRPLKVPVVPAVANELDLAGAAQTTATMSKVTVLGGADRGNPTTPTVTVPGTPESAGQNPPEMADLYQERDSKLDTTGIHLQGADAPSRIPGDEDSKEETRDDHTELKLDSSPSAREAESQPEADIHWHVQFPIIEGRYPGSNILHPALRYPNWKELGPILQEAAYELYRADVDAWNRQEWVRRAILSDEP